MKKLLLAFVLIIIGSVAVIWMLGKPESKPLPAGVVADRVLIEKGPRRLTLFRQGKRLKTYEVALGRNPQGKKTEEGDCRTPEGIYTIDRRKQSSRYHRALHISYPSSADVAQAKARSVSPGGDVMIHGLPNALGFVGKVHLIRDWTLGCVAVTNPDIEEIWRVVPDGVVVEIVP
ncbi:peptidoglycan L,D-transpeptidase, YkuD family [Geotalea daltonii FRC-32]|uniref:Peptidoglycan L,D-transpeptidase, YkuD family n=1 Tax=Geotalea daltonii (strain DSM 22248 / JCM 15807 / FRC-32) TaxID=316067 RepID=B9M247_GEODF|nr:L,D-transpeptidase family protein [Geotalea daltonii]ACM21165.1 peptidoglycan L,D-transpeptidase, YkuD family [Geotalea daltonii FRC-32]